MPAGTEIKVLIPGTNRPQKTKGTPYLSNHNLLLLKSLEEIPRNFPFLSRKFESLFSFTDLPKKYQGNDPRMVPSNPQKTKM